MAILRTMSDLPGAVQGASPNGAGSEYLLIDPLTGLGTRHALLVALEDALGTAGRPLLLVLFSLDGFDDYTTLFGQLAGRNLIVKLAARLGEALGPAGRAFRPRQDEFAALVETQIAGATAVIDGAVAALRERAAPVAVTASWGAAVLPDEATDPIAALKLADDRLVSNAPRRRRRNRRGPVPPS
jgi:diguanylate cyclase (GGDEF)-like protein